MSALCGIHFRGHSAIETENFELLYGNTMTTVGPAGSDGGHTITRCKTCGDPIYRHFLGNKKVLVLKTKSLDNADQYLPQSHIFTRSKLNWVVLGKDIPAFDEVLDREKLYTAESLERRSQMEWTVTLIKTAQSRTV